MGLEQVIDEVRTNADARAQAIVSEARAEAEQTVADAKAKVAEYEAKKLAQAEKDAVQLKAQAISHAEFEARKGRLEAESELRSTLRAQMLDAFAGLNKTTRNKHIKKLLKTAKEAIPEGRIWGNQTDEATLKKSDYEFSGSVDIVGGIIVESKDGRVRLDLSYETLLDDQWRNVLQAEAGLFA